MCLLFKRYKSQLNLKDYISVRFLKTLLSFTLNHNYIIYNNTTYKQCQIIPQGGQASSTIPYYFLYYYEMISMLPFVVRMI